jgi:hypothetical protein
MFWLEAMKTILTSSAEGFRRFFFLRVEPKPIMQAGAFSKWRKTAAARTAEREREINEGDRIACWTRLRFCFVHIKSSDVCNFAGILISLLLFFGVFCAALFFFVGHRHTAEPRRRRKSFSCIRHLINNRMTF